MEGMAGEDGATLSRTKVWDAYQRKATLRTVLAYVVGLVLLLLLGLALMADGTIDPDRADQQPSGRGACVMDPDSCAEQPEDPRGVPLP